MKPASDNTASGAGRPPDDSTMRPLHTRRRGRIQRIVQVVSMFFLGQGALQGLQMIIGLLLIRWLSVEAWAQYGLASGLQLTMTGLMDLGLSSTIIPLVGDRRHDLKLVGRYVRSARHLRDRTFWILAPITAVVFMAITYRHHWSLHTRLLLLASILVALYSSGQISCFSSPYFLSSRLREFYLPQTIAAAFRLIGLGACWLGGVLNAWIAAAMYAANALVSGTLLQKGSAQYLEWPDHDDRVTDREVIRCILPATPAIIFNAFQVQISLLLISIFGNSAKIAQVAALGRLGQIFGVLMTFNIVVVEPYVARLSRTNLLSVYIRFVALAVLFCAPITASSFLVPGVFLWILGPHYNDLSSLVGWVVMAACLNYVAGLMWIMNRARNWLFWSGSIVEIALVLSMQVAFLVVVGVRTTRDAVLFALASSVCVFVAHLYVTLLGFTTGRKRVVDRV